MKQRGNWDFAFANPIECAVQILVYKQLLPKNNPFKSTVYNWLLKTKQNTKAQLFWFSEGLTELKKHSYEDKQ